eukprot:SAG31_NODE_1875_length_7019_cov_39.090896_5_plen_60_part_00
MPAQRATGHGGEQSGIRLQEVDGGTQNFVFREKICAKYKCFTKRFGHQSSAALQFAASN